MVASLQKIIVVECDLVSAGPLLFGQKIRTVKETGEAHDSFEKRVWRERLHLNSDGNVIIPGIALKRTLESVATFLSETVPGKGKATYTKHFLAGTMVTEDILIEPPIKAKDVKEIIMNVPSDGKRGGKSRVDRIFPVIPQWRGHAEIVLIDPLLIEHTGKVEEYLNHAGKFIGLLSMRVRNGGNYGRFKIEKFKTKSL